MQLDFRFGRAVAGVAQAPHAIAIDLENPVIDGAACEPWAHLRGSGRGCGRLTLWRDDHAVWGAACVSLADLDHEAATRVLYADLLRATRRLALQRIWNFIPRINEQHGGLENYRAFCRGRHLAFESHFGTADEQRMPAASAVGTPGNRLVVVFVAGTEAVRYVENPEQTPAYRYPGRYGPKAPSFARASIVRRAGGVRLYVSGTASIRRSESMHAGDVAAQCELAIANLDLVARAAGLPGLDPGTRTFRVYLRDPGTWPTLRPLLRNRLLRPGDRYTVLQADICRRELLVELEACVDVGATAGHAAGPAPARQR